uniref:50S ribosomal protein L18 n=1 Tax=Rhizophora mucronata TaxID=61149 RepID=A0A2P2JJQ3_RHIMU
MKYLMIAMGLHVGKECKLLRLQSLVTDSYQIDHSGNLHDLQIDSMHINEVSYDRNGFARGERMQAFEIAISRHGFLPDRSFRKSS